MNLCHKNSYWAAMYSVIEDEKNLEFTYLRRKKIGLCVGENILCSPAACCSS